MSREYWYGELESLGERNLVESLRTCVPSDEVMTIDHASSLLSVEHQRIALKDLKHRRLSLRDRERHAHTSRALEVLAALRREIV